MLHRLTHLLTTFAVEKAVTKILGRLGNWCVERLSGWFLQPLFDAVDFLVNFGKVLVFATVGFLAVRLVFWFIRRTAPQQAR